MAGHKGSVLHATEAQGCAAEAGELQTTSLPLKPLCGLLYVGVDLTAATISKAYLRCLWQPAPWRSGLAWAMPCCPSGRHPGRCSTPTASAATPAASNSCPGGSRPAAHGRRRGRKGVRKGCLPETPATRQPVNAIFQGMGHIPKEGLGAMGASLHTGLVCLAFSCLRTEML